MSFFSKPDPFLFRREHTLEQRIEESLRMLKKHSNKIPIIIERMEDNKNGDVGLIDKNKYLVPLDLTYGQFLFTIRKRVELTPEKALFLFVEQNNGTYIMPGTTNMISDTYKKIVQSRTGNEKDSFLYMRYGVEKTFGAR